VAVGRQKLQNFEKPTGALDYYRLANNPRYIRLDRRER
jgi:hypothetical protein